MDAIAAKQFLISKTIEQANYEQTPLSDVEAKMLHFTETSPTLPDILQVNEQFEREYDSDEFEVKIAGLLKRARHRDRELLATGDGQWNDAIAALKDEDHYILVIAYAAFPDYRKTLRPTHRIRDYVLYVLIALGLVGAAIAIAVWRR